MIEKIAGRIAAGIFLAGLVAVYVVSDANTPLTTKAATPQQHLDMIFDAAFTASAAEVDAGLAPNPTPWATKVIDNFFADGKLGH